MRQTIGTSSLRAAMRNGVLAFCVLPLLAGCGAMSGVSDFINTKTKFSSSKYGVSASKRVTTSKNVPKGGGRYQVGKPYKVAGNWYTPKEDPNYDSTGAASWYGPNFHGRHTANGEIFDQFALTAAHPTLPLPSYVRVTNLENNRSIMVRVNDRGPFVGNREIDLSRRAAEMLDYTNKGTARVRVKYVGKAPLEGDDTRMLMASYNKPTQMERSTQQDTRIAMVATPEPQRDQLVAFPASWSAERPRDNVLVTPQGFNVVNATASTVSSTGLGPLFYAPDKAVDSSKAAELIDSAFAATEAMANRPKALNGWRESIDDDARAIRFQLGVFADPINAGNVEQAFALIGAVDAEQIAIGGKPATVLTLTHLKPGATRQDATQRAMQLGLTDAILY
ncbi:septal ring lytic transglycosylase RlpA family protein [Mariluticola halotolerans]|uniref:septal ring lytic transglycosylase RlpA family protein n=1 Tax=Mariluticola halotolerans TaxID=2909283 RepID=UPI003F62004E